MQIRTPSARFFPASIAFRWGWSGQPGAAALGFGLSALLSLWIFARGYWAPSAVDIGDLGAEVSSTEWYARMVVGLLLQLPLLVGAVAALFNLRHQGAMAARRPGPSP